MVKFAIVDLDAEMVRPYFLPWRKRMNRLFCEL